MTSLKTSIKTITYLSDTGCLEIQGASLFSYINPSIIVNGVTGVTPLLLSCNMSQYIYPQRGIERPGHKLLCTPVR
ncbi:hypothetical protein AOY67_15270 [Escherichia coli]|nr:hypothetical protein [Escherichia coli]EGE0091752.1 hypothetical protein [Escherichia coli]UMS86751.1 hypothetical protein AOY67_15270 [Escherichia coli]